ncbi:MAG: ABC transporter permease [Candidatus Dormibacteraeota bacterium]|nr:ABC transporter permease [Candidatus Dormibacteraeota bacterium]
MSQLAPVRRTPGTGLSPGSEARRNWNLIRELAITQFKLKYTGSALGYLWSLMKPLMLFAIMYLVFARFLKLSNSSPHFTLQLLVGIIFWNFFAETVGVGVGVIVGNGSLLKKASFPRLILVIAASVSSSMTFVINVVLIIVIAAPLHQLDLGWQSLAVFPLIIELYMLVLGLSLLLSSLFVFYRDLGHVWEISSQVLFYGSAIVYPLAPAFLGSKAKLLGMNPIAQIVEDVRHAIVTSEVPWTVQFTGWRFLVPVGAVLALVAIGYATFRHQTPKFAEYL